MRWVRFTADGNTAYGSVTGDTVTEIEIIQIIVERQRVAALDFHHDLRPPLDQRAQRNVR